MARVIKNQQNLSLSKERNSVLTANRREQIKKNIKKAVITGNIQLGKNGQAMTGLNLSSIKNKKQKKALAQMIKNAASGITKSKVNPLFR